MKIGILTLHSQINYGGVLQAYALQKHLRDNGYDAEVIDYWLTPMNTHLLGFWLSASKPLWYRAIRFPYWCIRDGFVWSDVRRRLRTMRFLRKQVKLSKQTYETFDKLKMLDGYDVVIVGSDQIWHPSNISLPNPFLLQWLDQVKGTPKKVAYAASFGVEEIPADRTMEYSLGLKNFDAIGVREEEGRHLVKQLSKRDAVCVVDPSLLLSRDEWLALSIFKTKRVKGNYIFCYWLGDLDKILPVLKALVRSGKTVFLLATWSWGWVHFRSNLKFRFYLLTHSRFHCCFDSGPKEFLGLIANSEAVISDSFHAMMFGAIFEKPMCIVHKSSEKRESMGARLWDFQRDYCCSGVVNEYPPASLDTLHLEQISVDHKRLLNAVVTSKRWLSSVLIK